MAAVVEFQCLILETGVAVRGGGSVAGLALRVAVLTTVLGTDRISWRAVREALAVKLVLISLVLLAGGAFS